MSKKSISNDYVLNKAKEAMETIKSYLDMEPKIQIEKVVMLKDRGLLKENRNYGARYVESERKLIVYPFKDEKLLNFVITKELFNANLPDSVSNVRIARDLGWEFARLITKIKDKTILDLWKKCCKTIDVEGTKYVGYKDLPSLSTVSNGLFLKRLFWILKSFDKYDTKITRNDLGRIIHELAMDLSYPFSKEELLIVNFLLENPSASVAELAETFGGQYSSLYRKYKKLVDNKIISQQKRVSIAKIGLIPVLVWAEGVKPNSKVYKRLRKKDFLFSIFHYFDYEGGSIFTYAAPKNKEIKKWLKESISDLRKATHMDINIFFPDYHYTNTSLSYYIPEEKTWVFSQDSWSRWADLVFSSPDIISSELTSLEFFNLRNVPLFKITALDMQIIREVWNDPYISIRKLVKKLRKNTNAVQSAVNKLKLNKVIVDITRVHYLGLSNILFLFIEGCFDELKLAVLTLNDMPNLVTYLIENGKDSVLLALIRLPSSIVNVVAKAISIVFSEQFNRVVIHMGKYIYWGSYKPPFHLWNEQKQAWMSQIKNNS